MGELNPVELLLDGLRLQGYERQVFLALFQLNGAQAAAVISHKANAPQPKTYQILQTFVSRGWVLTETERPTKYLLQPVSTIVEKEKAKIDLKWNDLTRAANELDNAKVAVPERGVMHLEAERPERFLMLRKTTARIFNLAEKSIRILTGSFWWAEDPEIEEALTAALERRVKVKLLWRPTSSVGDIAQQFTSKGLNLEARGLSKGPGQVRLSVIDDKYVILVIFRVKHIEDRQIEEEKDPSDVLVISDESLASLISDAYEYKWKAAGEDRS